MKFLNRVLMLTFGVNRTLDLSKETLNENSLKRFYSEFWNLGLELKAFDERSGNAGNRSFFEADHFVLSADGNNKVNLQESFELVNVIISAGLTGLDKIQKDLNESICALSEKDHFGNNWLDEKCFKKMFKQNFNYYFKNLPALINWSSHLSEEQWDLFYDELVGFSRLNPKMAGRIETSDLRTMVVITHYIESMYLKFDTDLDDRLSLNELIVGSNRFKTFFKDLFKLEPRGPFLRETQEYLIDYAISRAFACTVLLGELPKVSTCTPTLLGNSIKNKSYSNRTLILRTLNSFKASIK